MREPYIGNPQSRIPTTRRNDMVATGPVREHIRALQSIGMTPTMIERSAGLSTSAIPRLLERQLMVRRVVADAVLAVDGRPTHQQAIVLNIGCRRRLEGLSVIGYSCDAIGKAIGTDRGRIYNLRTQARVSWLQHRAVAEAFDRLGPDGGSNRARRYAARQGWVHPLLWEDIDDPFEVPAVPGDSGLPDPVAVDRLVEGRSVSATAADKREAFGQLLFRGVSVNRAAVQLGINYQTAVRYSETLVAA